MLSVESFQQKTQQKLGTIKFVISTEITETYVDKGTSFGQEACPLHKFQTIDDIVTKLED